jgi:type II secretory pathway pseudopilin PulG
MKYLISLLIVCFGAGCATRKDSTPKVATVVPGTSLPAKRMPSVRTPEVVKAYLVGRYTDPNYPEEMHEQHAVYRREQSPDWNYLPDPPPLLPSGNPSYCVDATGELNAQQRAYAEALQEQNRAMQKRIESLQREAGKVPGLQQELDQLKQNAGESPRPQPTPEPTPAPAKIEDVDVFSSVEPELPAWEQGVSDPGEITLFAESDAQTQDFLLSQMRLNDEFATELAAAERRKISAVINAPFLRRKEFVLLNH